MNILQVVARYYPDIGGLEEHVRNISERLAKKHEVIVCTTDASGKLPREETIGHVKVKRFKAWAPGEAYFFSRQLEKYLDENSSGFDVVHAHGYHSFPPLYAAQSKKENRFFFTPHFHGTGHTFLRRFLHRPYRIVAKRIFEKADRIVCVSEYEWCLVSKNFKINEAKVAIVPNGFDLEEFRNLCKQKKDSRVILCVGRLEKYKGMHYLIEVLTRMDKDVSLDIVGKGPYKESLVRLTNKLNVADRVRFLQDLPRPDLLKLYADADLFVLLSRHEAYGLSVGEALCAGTPCLVANASGLKEWVDNRNCYGIDYPVDLDELGRVMKNVIGKPVSFLPPKVWDWNEVTEELDALYESC